MADKKEEEIPKKIKDLGKAIAECPTINKRIEELKKEHDVSDEELEAIAGGGWEVLFINIGQGGINFKWPPEAIIYQESKKQKN